MARRVPLLCPTETTRILLYYNSKTKGKSSMLAKVYSGAVVGVNAVPVEIEVNAGGAGEINQIIVGLPDAAVSES